MIFPQFKGTTIVVWKRNTEHRDLFNTKTQKDLPNETEQSLMLLYWYNPRHLQELKILAASGTCNCIKLAVDNRNVMKQKCMVMVMNMDFRSRNIPRRNFTVI